MLNSLKETPMGIIKKLPNNAHKIPHQNHVETCIFAAVRETVVKTGVAREMHEFSLF